MIRLRRLTPNDPALAATASLVRAAFAPQIARLGGVGRRDTAETLATRLIDGPGCIAVRDGEAVGCVFTRASRDHPGAWYLGNLAVAERARGQGLAHRLEGFAESEARRRGLTRLTLDTWADPRGPRSLFDRWGYDAIGGADGAVSMMRTLQSPCRSVAREPALTQTLDLIHTAFASMDGRIDPPSSIRDLTLDTLRTHAERGELWTLGAPPLAALIAIPRSDHLYLGKLAIAPAARGRGLARVLIARVEKHARTLGLPRLRLQTRIELVENHAIFAALGFVETGRTAHPGFDRPTSVSYERRVP